MGMFDEVVCKYPIPNTRYQAAVFQTKDLDCTLAHYTITESGRLVIAEQSFVDDENAPLGFRIVDTGDVHDLQFHGDLYFYHYVSHTGEFLEYIARFTNGAVDWIKPIDVVYPQEQNEP